MPRRTYYSVTVELNYGEEYCFDYNTKEEAELAEKYFSELLERTGVMHGGCFNITISEQEEKLEGCESEPLFVCTGTGPVRGDCTSSYNFKLLKECTVRELRDAILNNKGEWGYIGIFSKEIPTFFGDPKMEYRYGEKLTDLSEDILDRKVVGISGDGGWSRMDYLLYLD